MSRRTRFRSLRRRLPLLLPALTCLLSAEAAPLKAPIVRVRLHPDEAWVMRAGHLHLEGPGLHRPELRDLPPGLRLEDLQVNAKGPSGTRLGDVAVKADVRTVAETPEWKRLEAEMEALRDKQDALEAQRDALKQEQTFLKSLQASHAQELSARMAYTLPQAQSLAEFGKGLQARLATLMQQERRAQRDLDALKLEQARVQAEMDQRRGQQRTAPSLVTLELTTPAAGFVEVELNYRQTQARWRPVYEARLSEDRKTLGLVLTAAVTQSTGESWEGVRLEISNARPSRGLAVTTYEEAQLITRVTLRTSLASVESLPKGRDFNSIAMLAPGLAPRGFEGQVLTVDKTREQVEVAADQDATLTEEASGLAATWTLDGAKDIPSDGEAHRFRVLSRDLAPRPASRAKRSRSRVSTHLRTSRSSPGPPSPTMWAASAWVTASSRCRRQASPSPSASVPTSPCG
jgi:uncharacterized protein (TIGR02231 family)